MRIKAHMAQEFDQIVAEYARVDDQGMVIIHLVKMFCDEYDDYDDELDGLYYLNAWQDFLSEHKHQLTVPMVGQIIYLLTNYWPQGDSLYSALPTLEKMLSRDTIQEIAEAKELISAANSNSTGDRSSVDPEGVGQVEG